MHSLHLVDQKSTTMVLSVALARSFLMSSTLAVVSFTGSALIFAASSLTPVALDSHFVEQPKAGVDGTGTGWPASKASIALRASCDFTFAMAVLSSMWPS